MKKVTGCLRIGKCREWIALFTLGVIIPATQPGCVSYPKHKRGKAVAYVAGYSEGLKDGLNECVKFEGNKLK